MWKINYSGDVIKLAKTMEIIKTVFVFSIFHSSVVITTISFNLC